MADDYRTRTRLEQLQALLDEYLPARSASIGISAPHDGPACPWILDLFHWTVAEALLLEDSACLSSTRQSYTRLAIKPWLKSTARSKLKEYSPPMRNIEGRKQVGSPEFLQPFCLRIAGSVARMMSLLSKLRLIPNPIQWVAPEHEE